MGGNCLCTDKGTEKNDIISRSLEIIGFEWNCVDIKKKNVLMPSEIF